ncbi:hypothetical protein FHS00_002567 [Limimaricola variabilis]|jgi:hypothetical protein|uniref:Uncharacterized protein n=1 Tax=Limimaricola variabilis TaxID=1492771 RepID=A0ABR6HQZ3_9RHOB|nr:hypothetical protein [Limimaricola variabilis]MBB3712969.1 hypothetical protein [Limimaricola variabilis]WPY95775.1 hypothetical protein T8T21_06545 [Limimaricola variabilis]
MSAPHTDVEKQEKRHKGPLTGMAIVAVFGVLLILLLVFLGFGQGNEPEAESTVEAVGSGEVETESEDIVGAPEQINDSVGTAEQQ